MIDEPGSPLIPQPATAGAAEISPEAAVATHSAHAHPPRHPAYTFKNFVWLLFFMALTAAATCANYRDVFVTDANGVIRQVYYVDGDCYSRMTRVREILQGWGVIHYHIWENYPVGILPHTTAPFDYLIVALALLLKPFTQNYIDLAGAFISPILGVLTTAFIAFWARQLNQQYRKLTLLLVSLSPILVHGDALGRPAHHSLQIFLVAIGIGAELVLARRPSIDWAIVSGVAWGLAIWVSLYEPLVMLIVIYVTKIVFYRPHLFVKERLWGLGVFVTILGIAYLIEGRWIAQGIYAEFHNQTLREYFGNWSATIAEMTPSARLDGTLPLGLDNILFRSLGWGLLASPLLLMARLRDTKRSILLLALLVTTFIFTMLQARWGYFLALVYAMSLPWQLSLFKQKWIVYIVYGISLWPVAMEWDAIIPNPTTTVSREAQINDEARMRQTAEFIGDKAPGAILAPWWWTPKLVYWSGQPGVAGSSHESLAGIVDTSRFFATTDPKEAQAICDSRYVETVVIGNPSNIVIESCRILGRPLPDKENTMADLLWKAPHSAPVFLHLIRDDGVFKVFEVNHGYVNR